MSCTDPRPGLLVPANTKTGRKVKFLSDLLRKCDYANIVEKYGDNFVWIPCGKCDSCIEQRTKSWAIRCTLEAAQYEDNCFLTLTYNNQCVPKGGLQKKEFQKFIKALRNKYGAGIRYFGCGEYGSKYDRPHYHIIVFNFFPKDAEPVKYDAVTQCIYYRSKELQSLWKFGFVSIGEVTYNSCAYVARYCQKKIKDMGIVRQNPEFSLMSRRPGIGQKYFEDHYDSLINTDRIYININDKVFFSSFRYFDKLIERVDPAKLQELKNQRIRNGEVSVASELLTRSLPDIQAWLLHQSEITGEKYNRLKRRI